MSEDGNLRDAGDQIDRLLQEVRSMSTPLAWQRVDELVRLVVGLYGAGLRRIMEITGEIDAGEQLRALMARDDLVGSLLLLHQLHLDDMETRVRTALARVRPYLGSHGGDVEIVGVDAESGVVRLRLGGSCDGCPSSMLTVKLAVEGAIRELAPEATEIEVEGVVSKSARKGSEGAPAEPQWIELAAMPEIVAGGSAATNVNGVAIAVWRVGEQLYAYHDACPSCRSAINSGGLNGSLLGCPSCGLRFDLQLAGRSLANREIHLEPVPLLQGTDSVKVALASAV
jgi:Fe-S cluster biogenesis protein NfuA/nitrite reductase/ring-hydroxylating ferredoxin subunit